MIDQAAWRKGVEEDPLGRALLARVDASPLRVEFTARDALGGQPVGIEREPGGMVLRTAFEGASAAFILSHELGHVLAATVEDLQTPNLGLVFDERTWRAKHIETLTMAWQVAICRAARGNAEDKRLESGINIFRSAVGLKPEDVWALAPRYERQLETHWERQMGRVRELNPMNVAMAA